jgi:hypothetical protein
MPPGRSRGAVRNARRRGRLRLASPARARCLLGHRSPSLSSTARPLACARRDAHDLGVDRALLVRGGAHGRERQRRLDDRRPARPQLRHELAALAQRPGQQLGQIDPAPGHRGRQQQRRVGPVLARRLLDDRGGLDADLPARRREVQIVGRLPARARDEVLQLQLGAGARQVDDGDDVDDPVGEAAPIQRLARRPAGGRAP